MKISEIKKLDKCVAEDFPKENINISVYLVYRGSFNDERLIESKSYSVNELLDKPPVWFDIYLDKKAENTTKAAFIYFKNQSVYLLEDDGKKTKVVKKQLFTPIYSDDYDEKYIIATHIW